MCVQQTGCTGGNNDIGMCVQQTGCTGGNNGIGMSVQQTGCTGGNSDIGMCVQRTGCTGGNNDIGMCAEQTCGTGGNDIGAGTDIDFFVSCTPALTLVISSIVSTRRTDHVSLPLRHDEHLPTQLRNTHAIEYLCIHFSICCTRSSSYNGHDQPTEYCTAQSDANTHRSGVLLLFIATSGIETKIIVLQDPRDRK
jgi:hypothetical protein